MYGLFLVALILFLATPCEGKYETRKFDSVVSSNFSSLAYDARGTPMIAYNDHSELKLVRCTDPGCLNQLSPVVIDQFTGSEMGLFVDMITHPVAGNPCLAYLMKSTAGSKVKISCCATQDCRGVIYRHEIDTARDFTSEDEYLVSVDIVKQIDGNGSNTYHPLVAYNSNSNGLRVSFCHDFSCTERTLNNIANVDLTSVKLIVHGGLPSLFYNKDDKVSNCRCSDTSCSSCATNLTEIYEGQSSVAYVFPPFFSILL